MADSDNMFVSVCVISSAPTAPPSSVNAMVESSSSITAQWGEVPCIHQNGAITGYSVRYHVVRDPSTGTVVNISGGSVSETTISNLNSSTNYSIHVAAKSSAGTGEYSSYVFMETPQG